MDIRLATMEDMNTFNKMYTAFLGEENFKPMKKEKYQSYLELESIYFAVLDEKIMGYAIVLGVENVGAKIRQFFMKERRKGYGTQFYSLLEQEIKSYNFKDIFLWVLGEEAESFWTKMGFKSINGGDEFYKTL